MTPPDAAMLERASQHLGTRDALFMKRVYQGGLDAYRRRLKAIGFEALSSVLDAGCGFGQWTMVLADTCTTVAAVDLDPARVSAAREMLSGRPNVTLQQASIESLPFPDHHFEAVFSYSVLYYTDVRKSVKELCRVLRPGGLLYICSNGLGWYLYNLIAQPHKSHDFSPARYALATFRDTILYRCGGRPPRAGSSVVTSRRWLAHVLREEGMVLIAVAAEGCATLNGAESGTSFFDGYYRGFECVSEWLAKKQGAAES